MAQMVEESACDVGDPDSIPGWGRSPGEGNEWQPTPLLLPGEYHGQGLQSWGEFLQLLSACSLFSFLFCDFHL